MLLTSQSNNQLDDMQAERLEQAIAESNRAIKKSKPR
jgi:hypothetical protein